MRRIYIRNTFFVLIFLFTLTSAVMNQSGPNASMTNAPGTGESNCTSCHSGSLVTSGTNFDNIFLTTGFQGNGYVPDSTYTMSLSFKQSGISRYGFQITCLTSIGNLPAGTLGATNTRVQKITGVISGNTRQYIEQTSTGSDTVKKDSTRWVFTWKAPSSNIGKVKFYACVNATNSSGTNSGDIIYAKTFEFNASNLLPTADATSIDSVTCTNYNAQMTGKGTNTTTSYAWKFINANISTSAVQNPIVKFTVPGTQLAILTVKNSLGFSLPDTLKIIVKNSPAASVLNGTSSTICKGDSIQLSANTGVGLTYKWNPTNKTNRIIFVKDSGNYNVTTTSTTSLCATTSNNFKLNWYSLPSISITKILTNDTFCNQISETFTGSGTGLDSIHWYVNNKLFARTKTLSLTYNGKSNSTIFAIGKSINSCLSLKSNSFNLVVVPKIFPSNFSNTKTSSTINLKWKKTTGIDSVKYSLNNISFSLTSTDSTLLLAGLQPSTFYNITIRSYQKNICKFTDTIISIKTNNCSNISYNIVMNSRICLGDTISVLVQNLPKSNVSVSFNNLPFSTDTTYSFSPLVSDSLVIKIIDSLSLSCPTIIDKQAYLVDTFPNDNGIYNFNISSCINTYTYAINPLYQKYEFYKNNIKQYSGPNNLFNYTGLKTGDLLTAFVFVNSCSKKIGSATFSLSLPSNATYTYSRNWKTYTFTPVDTTNTNYTWYINDTLVANSQKLVRDMSNYNNNSANIKLKTTNFSGCTDSFSQTIQFPNFLSVTNLSNYQLNIFPNPFNSEIEIKTNLMDYQLDVYDNLGRSILHLVDLQNNHSLNTSDWLNGMYHIVLSNAYLKLDRIIIKVE